ncbi:PH domain-containing protein [Pseudarthrobacter sp. BIM B-2242]|uniref:PH domain-containing protein n=1 Tax=Pseudarthrobacter sp. BIM B-2242 TaxID=2772401 RepID=UPI00168B806E|nr:PH domain-containing protein [Pseudarthrobacter sp. BIM B-2242]QOD06153.1 PH domain-containing protein [Pseudarthrobacter sp. BIM B-2242]
MPRQPFRTDIAAAVRRAGTSAWGCGRELRRLEGHLGHGERVRRIAGARYLGKIGVIVLTDRRVLFIVEGVFRRICDEFPYARLTLVGWRSFFGSGTITLHVGAHHAVVSGIDAAIGKSIVTALRHELARVDARTQLALARQDRLYTMVEHIYGLHVPEDDAGSILEEDGPDGVAVERVPVTG